jgi:hypothetical protein
VLAKAECQERETTLLPLVQQTQCSIKKMAEIDWVFCGGDFSDDKDGDFSDDKDA